MYVPLKIVLISGIPLPAAKYIVFLGRGAGTMSFPASTLGMLLDGECSTDPYADSGGSLGKSGENPG